MTDRLIIRQPDDWHVHLRDNEMLAAVTPYTAKQFARAIIMPNLVPPITSAMMGELYRARILASLPEDTDFIPLMTCYLTDTLDPLELENGHKTGVFLAAKLYPAGATTNSDSGVTNIENIFPLLEVMQRCGMPLLVHGEVTHADIDIFDREAVFIDTIMAKIVANFSDLKIVVEHITTKNAVDFVTESNDKIAATITPHHLVYNRTHIFEGGIRPHRYCLPIAKREDHRLALRKAAISGNAKFFLGTDTAPHMIQRKESVCGCAGIFNAPYAIESYAKTFDEEGALDQLEGFASEHGPNFYNLPLNTRKIVLTKTSVTVPDSFDVLNTSLIPFHAGESLPWAFAGFEDEQ